MENNFFTSAVGAIGRRDVFIGMGMGASGAIITYIADTQLSHQHIIPIVTVIWVMFFSFQEV